MKYTTFLSLAILIGLSSCSSYKRIGDLTIIGTRNIDSKTDYAEIKRYSEGKGETIEIAVDQAVKNTNGGDFLKNVQIYTNGKRFKVVGDVWGLNTTRAYSNTNRPTVTYVATQPQPVATPEPQQVVVATSQPAPQQVHSATNVYAVGDKVSFQKALLDKSLTPGEIIGLEDKKAVVRYMVKGKSYTEKVALEKLTKVAE